MRLLRSLWIDYSLIKRREFLKNIRFESDGYLYFTPDREIIWYKIEHLLIPDLKIEKLV